MKKGIALSPAATDFAPLFFSGDLKRGMEKAAELGYNGVEISVRDPKTLSAAEILGMTKSLGLEIVTLATGQSCVDGGMKLVTDDKVLLERTIDRIKSVIDFAAEVGAGYITLGGIRGNAKYASQAQMEEDFVGTLATCAEYATKQNIGILLEPVNHYEVSTIFRMDQAAAIIEKTGCKNIKVLYDVYHVNMEESSFFAPIAKYGQNFGVVHFADSNRLAPSLGHMPFFDIVDCLRAVGFDGYLTVESLPAPDDGAMAARAAKLLELLCDKEV